eukprot:TRINITY_DN2882_c0_g1_i1.p1 TRINITY_DN2882_c0_g1~~TRINITY_DN2882_c0_g1_i1.p1  ORF type:complete len:170 (+),score=11.25 TRINITY_DN2882_c0_g1_i1:45-512(+)
MSFQPEKRNILVALDANPFSLKPFAYAIRNSRPEDQIVLLTLVEHKAKSLFSSTNEEILKENKKSMENGFALLSTYLNKCKELGRNCTGQVVGVESWSGPLHIAEEICKVATRERADIVLGNTGFIPKGTLAKHSTAIVENAVKDCPCNITVVRE